MKSLRLLELLATPQEKALPPFQNSDLEAHFQIWYNQWASRWGLDSNPDALAHQYDYRRAFLAGLGPDEDGHWPSEFKLKGHPNRFVDGIDTITGLPVLGESPK